MGSAQQRLGNHVESPQQSAHEIQISTERQALPISLFARNPRVTGTIFTVASIKRAIARANLPELRESKCRVLVEDRESDEGVWQDDFREWNEEFTNYLDLIDLSREKSGKVVQSLDHTEKLLRNLAGLVRHADRALFHCQARQ